MTNTPTPPRNATDQLPPIGHPDLLNYTRTHPVRTHVWADGYTTGYDTGHAIGIEEGIALGILIGRDQGTYSEGVAAGRAQLAAELAAADAAYQNELRASRNIPAHAELTRRRDTHTQPARTAEEIRRGAWTSWFGTRSATTAA